MSAAVLAASSRARMSRNLSACSLVAPRGSSSSYRRFSPLWRIEPTSRYRNASRNGCQDTARKIILVTMTALCYGNSGLARLVQRVSTWALENCRFDGPSLQPREFHQVVRVESRRKDGPLPDRRRIFGDPLLSGQLRGKTITESGSRAPETRS